MFPSEPSRSSRRWPSSRKNIRSYSSEKRPRLLETRCYECHADGANKGGLDFDALSTDLRDAVFAKWERIFDRVVAGEMPPANLKDRPPPRN